MNRLMYLTVKEFKDLKRAVAILCRAGMEQEAAILLLLDARNDRIVRNNNYRREFSPSIAK